MYQIWVENENLDGFTMRTECERHETAEQVARVIFRKLDHRRTVEVRYVVPVKIVNRFEAV